MSDSALNLAERISAEVDAPAEWEMKLRAAIDQAANEKYKPLVEAVESYIAGNDSADCAKRYKRMRQALKAVKS